MDQAPAVVSTAPTMGVVAKLNYSHTDMIDFIIANPGVSQGALAARYGYSPAWISNVMASDAWKMQLAARREELIDPVLCMTLQEKFGALAEKSIEVLMTKLSAPVVSDNVALKAADLGARGAGVGNAAPQATQQDHLAALANRLIDLQSNIRKGVTIHGTSQEISDQEG